MSAVTLTCVPSIVDELTTEPKLDDEPESVPYSRVLATHISASAGDAFLPGMGAGLIGGNISTNILTGVLAASTSTFSSIADIVRAVRSGTTGIPTDQLSRLGYNSREFYSAIGAIGSIIIPSARIIAELAKNVGHEFPSLWYVNFPDNMSAADVESVARHRQSMLDFRSWSSKKWWEEVNRRFGKPDEAIARISQSREFAQIACEDMVRMSWLRTIRQPNTYGYTIDCQRYELHAQIVARVFGDGWWVPDEDTVRILEPIFESIVRGASAGSQEYSQMHNVVMEKYSYDRTNKTITSYIRLISFEIREYCYEHITQGKHGTRQSRVQVKLSLCLYEAIFETALWDKFSATLDDDETDLLKDFVKSRTIELLERR
ncbi:hypothetical protein P885DRAFT_58854 [Corynascus similis CBS 632.67]